MNHSFDIEHARQYGIPAAILIENFSFWISKNRANEKHLMEGRTWSYNSVKAFQELFPYMGLKQIRAALDKLVTEGVLLKRDWNEGKADRTLWYAFRDEEAFIGPVDHLPKKAIGMPKRDKASAQKGELTNKTDINTDSRTRGARLPQEWFLTKAWAEEARAIHPSWTDEHIRFEADKFKDHWIAVSGQKGIKTDWLATWRNWCRNAGPIAAAGKGVGGPWWLSEGTKLTKALEVGVGPANRGEPTAAWEARIRAAINNGGRPPEVDRPAQAVTIRDPNADMPGKVVISEENRAAFMAAKQGLKKGTGLSLGA